MEILTNAGIVAPSDAQEPASPSQGAETVEETPASVSTSESALSASEGQVTVGGVQVIPEHVQDGGQASNEGQGA